MRGRSVKHFFKSAGTTLVEQHRQMLSAGISFLLHVIFLCSIISASSALSHLQPAMVIDFSIEKKSSDISTKKKIANTNTNPSPKPKPKPKPKAQKTLAEPQVKKVIIQEKPLPPPPKKVVKPTELVPIEARKEVVQEVVPEQIVAEQPPVEQQPEETVQEIPTVVEDNAADDDLEKSASPDVFGLPVQHKEQYVKEHFLYIKESVQSQISYPRLARKMGWQGKVLVSFVICKDGSVKDIKIIESSGFKVLDKNAVEVIQKVAPFPHPPVSAELIIPILYKLS